MCEVIQEINNLRLNAQYDQALEKAEQLYKQESDSLEVRRLLCATYYDKALSFWHRSDKHYLLTLISDEAIKDSSAFLERALQLAEEGEGKKRIESALNKCKSSLKGGSFFGKGPLAPMSSVWKNNRRHLNSIIPLIPQPDLTKKETWMAVVKAGTGMGFAAVTGGSPMRGLKHLFDMNLKYTQFEHSIHFRDHIASKADGCLIESKYTDYGWGLFKGTYISNNGKYVVIDDWGFALGEV